MWPQNEFEASGVWAVFKRVPGEVGVHGHAPLFCFSNLMQENKTPADGRAMRGKGPGSRNHYMEKRCTWTETFGPELSHILSHMC